MSSLIATLRNAMTPLRRRTCRMGGYLVLAYALLIVIGLAFAGRQAVAQEPDGDEARPQQDEYEFYLPMAVHQPPPTSFQLIERALERGEIDEETALTYKVFAAFGDERLPEQYTGDDSEILETNVGVEVMAQWDDLSAETQETIGPFMVQPIYEGSWWHLERTRAAPQNTVDGHVPPCVPRQECTINEDEWDYVGGQDVKVWYPSHLSDQLRTRAEFVRDTIGGEVWPPLTGYMDREPLSDADQENNGGDPRLDIALLPFDTVQSRNLVGVLGEVLPYDGCWNTPTFMILNSLMGEQTLRSTLAHELMHTIQFTYDIQATCRNYDWWNEASARWAEFYVYDQLDVYKDDVSDYLLRPDRPLNFTNGSAEYGAYLWPFYLHQTNPNQDLIRNIWEITDTQDSLAATEQALAGAGLDRDPDDKVVDQWQPFTLANWNRPPVTVYRQWDNLFFPALRFSDTVSLEGRSDAEFKLLQESLPNGLQDEELPPLSSVYYYFTNFGDDARSVLFANGFGFTLNKEMVHFDSVPGAPLDLQGELFTYGPQGNGNEDAQEGARIWLLANIGGEWQEPQDVTHNPGMAWCRDLPEERIEDLVLILSNGRRDEALSPQGLAPRLWVSNVGCGQWTLQDPIEPDLPVTDQFDDDEEVTIVEATDNQTIDNVVFEPLPHRPRSGGLVVNPIYEYELTQGTLSYQVSGEVRQTGFDDPDRAIVCTVDESGGSPLFTGVEEDGFRPNRLVTLNYVLGGDAYRSYLMHIFETEDELSFTETCTDTGTGDEWTQQWTYQVSGLAAPGDEISAITISANGAALEGETEWVGNYYTDPGPGNWRFEGQQVQ